MTARNWSSPTSSAGTGAGPRGSGPRRRGAACCWTAPERGSRTARRRGCLQGWRTCCCRADFCAFFFLSQSMSRSCALCGGPCSSCWSLVFLRELESQVISTRFAGSPKPLVGTSEADFCAFFFPATVHDRPCRSCALCGGPCSSCWSLVFLRELESQVISTRFAGSPKPLVGASEADFCAFLFSCDSP